MAKNSGIKVQDINLTGGSGEGLGNDRALRIVADIEGKRMGGGGGAFGDGSGMAGAGDDPVSDGAGRRSERRRLEIAV